MWVFFVRFFAESVLKSIIMVCSVSKSRVELNALLFEGKKLHSFGSLLPIIDGILCVHIYLITKVVPTTVCEFENHYYFV
jgi:hypothetical protein